MKYMFLFYDYLYLYSYWYRNWCYWTPTVRPLGSFVGSRHPWAHAWEQCFSSNWSPTEVLKSGKCSCSFLSDFIRALVWQSRRIMELWKYFNIVKTKEVQQTDSHFHLLLLTGLIELCVYFFLNLWVAPS